MAIARDAIAPAVLPRETVQVDAIGGEVVVQGFDMQQMLAFHAHRRRLVVPLDGESPDDAIERAGAALVPWALSRTVLADDGKPVYTEDQWRAFGGRHAVACIELYHVAMRLSGSDDSAEKKS